MSMIIAGLWGFAEATLFFIVPDVWLTLIAVRRGLVSALIACGFALAGALIGGTIMYAWGVVDIDSARNLLDWVPSIDKGMIKDTRRALSHDGVEALFVGALTGVPYKIYAVEASGADIGLMAFLAASIPARLLRFGLVIAAVWAISYALSFHFGRQIRTIVLLSNWGVFYVFYLSIMPN